MPLFLTEALYVLGFAAGAVVASAAAHLLLLAVVRVLRRSKSVIRRRTLGRAAPQRPDEPPAGRPAPRPTAPRASADTL